jgi:hypothetical protein
MNEKLFLSQEDVIIPTMWRMKFIRDLVDGLFAN